MATVRGLFPWYIHLLALVALLLGVSVASGSENVATTYEVILWSLVFWLMPYVVCMAPIIPDLIDLAVRYPWIKREEKQLEIYIREKTQFLLEYDAIDKTGRVKCPSCGFRSKTERNYLFCAKCHEAIVIKEKT